MVVGGGDSGSYCSYGYGKWSGGRGGEGGGWLFAIDILCSCFIIILMSSLYYLNEMIKNIEVLMFDVS